MTSSLYNEYRQYFQILYWILLVLFKRSFGIWL